MLLLGVVSQSYTIQHWRNHRLKNPIQQTIHAVWSLFAALGPLIIAPFLVDISRHHSMNDVNESNRSASAFVESYNSSNYLITSMNNEYNDTTESQTYHTVPDVSMVRYAYIAFGLPGFIPAFAFIYVHLRKSEPHQLPAQSKPILDHTVPKTKVINNPTKRTVETTSSFTSAHDRIIIISLMFAFYVFYTSIDNIPRGFLTIFTAKYLGWTTINSTLINTIYSGCLFAGRLVGVPLSAVLRPRTILAVNLSLIVVASFFMLLAEWNGGVLVWPAAGLLGYGVSTTMGGM